MDSLDRFLSRLERARDDVRRSGLSEAIILHHDEADGLASGALARLAMEAMGLSTKTICLDKLYPDVIADVENESKRVVALADLGSGHIGWLTKHNVPENPIVILDHHDTVESNNPFIYNLNPELDGFSGDLDASASTVAYFFAKFVDPRLSKHAHLGMIGADEIPGEPRGLNKIVVKDCLEQGLVKASGNSYKIELDGFHASPERLASSLNILGSVGYYRDGPRRGLDACLNGFSEETLGLAKNWEEERKEANRRMLEMVSGDGLHKEKKMIQWFHARDNYARMSGKVIGSFCSYLSYQRHSDPTRYLIGMMNVPPEIPGWGTLSSSLVKASGRAPKQLAESIQKGEKPALSEILSQACLTAGGFGDGHKVAASGVFQVGKEEVFLSELERMAVRTAKPKLPYQTELV